MEVAIKRNEKIENRTSVIKRKDKNIFHSQWPSLDINRKYYQLIKVKAIRVESNAKRINWEMQINLPKHHEDP